jgi:hypothetical protein
MGRQRVLTGAPVSAAATQSVPNDIALDYPTLPNVMPLPSLLPVQGSCFPTRRHHPSKRPLLYVIDGGRRNSDRGRAGEMGLLIAASRAANSRVACEVSRSDAFTPAKDNDGHSRTVCPSRASDACVRPLDPSSDMSLK